MNTAVKINSENSRLARAAAETAVLCFKASKQAAEAAISYAFMSGVALLRVKELSPHGSFEMMIRSGVHFGDMPRSTITLYMAFSKRVMALAGEDKLPKITLPKDGTLTDAQNAKLVEYVGGVVEGKTVTEIWRNLGVIKKPTPPQYHPKKPLANIDDQIRSENEVAMLELEAIERSISHGITEVTTGSLVTRIKTTRLKQHLALVRQYSKAIEPFTKRRLSRAERRGEK